MMTHNVEGEVNAHTGNSNTKWISEIEEPKYDGTEKEKCGWGYQERLLGGDKSSVSKDLRIREVRTCLRIGK